MNQKKSKPTIYYQISLNIRSKKCIVVGGGEVALRKIKMLLDCGAKVTLVSPALHPDLAQLVEEKAIHSIQRNYRPGDLEDATLVIAATDRKEINRKVARDAKKQRIPVNVADDPELSDYIVPSFFRQGDLTIAVSTAGRSPALAKKIRTKLERNFGEEYASLLTLIGEVRSEIKRKGLRVSAEAWQKALNLDSLVGLVRAGQKEEAKAILLKKLKCGQDGV